MASDWLNGRFCVSKSCAGSRVCAKSKPLEANATAVTGASVPLPCGNEQPEPLATVSMGKMASPLLDEGAPALTLGPPLSPGNCRNGRGAAKSLTPACATATHCLSGEMATSTGSGAPTNGVLKVLPSGLTTVTTFFTMPPQLTGSPPPP